MSKSSKKEVGKGIRALLSNIDKSESGTKKELTDLKGSPIATNQLALKLIEPNPFQPRTEFDEEELAELMDSIKTHGIIQPLAVRKLNKNSFQIISGERRYRAAKKLKLEKVPVHILEADDQSMLEIALLENIQRADLNPLEIALSYQRLIDDCALTHEELSQRLGKKRSSISNYLRLLKLSPSVQKAVKEEQISLGHAKVLAGVELIEIQTLLLGRIIRDDLSVRATEELVRSVNAQRKSGSKNKSPQSPIILDISKKLSERIGTKIQIQRSEKGNGYIRIPFSSDKEFNEIIDTLLDE